MKDTWTAFTMLNHSHMYKSHVNDLCASGCLFRYQIQAEEMRLVDCSHIAHLQGCRQKCNHKITYRIRHITNTFKVPYSMARGVNVIIRAITQTAYIKCPFASFLCVNRVSVRVGLFAFLSLVELSKTDKYGVFTAIARHLFCCSCPFGHHSL